MEYYMDYYEVAFNKAPIIAYAHAYKPDIYRWNLTKKDDFIQITYIERGVVHKRYPDGTERIFNAPCYITNIYNYPVELYGESNHCHYTAGFFLEHKVVSVSETILSLPLCEVHRVPGAELRVMLPEYLPANKQNDKLRIMILKLIKVHELPSSWKDAKSSAIFMSIMSTMSAQCQKNVKNTPGNDFRPGSERYFDKAVIYISENLHRQLSVAEIASQVGISCGYLSRLFKEFSERTVIDYINHVKIEKVRELIDVNGLHLWEAGQYVGISDENYLYRLFKKYTNMSVREFKTLNRYKD